MNLVGLEGEDRKTYAFNAKNTRITKKAARNLPNAARKRITIKIKSKAPATGVTDQDDNDKNLCEAFTLLPHQIAGMSPVSFRSRLYAPCRSRSPVLVLVNAGRRG